MKLFEIAPLSLSRTNNLKNQTMFSQLNKTSSVPVDPKYHVADLLTKQEPIYDHWQSELAMEVYRSLRNGPPINLIVNVSPAGGKSSPISKAWQAILEQTPYIDRAPKILWVCANKTLTEEKYKDFKKDVINMFIKSINIQHSLPKNIPDKTEIKMNDNPALQAHLVNQIYNIPGTTEFNQPIDPQIANGIRHNVDRLVGFQMMGNNIVGVTPNTIAYSCTYSYAPKIIEQMRPKLIVIDELQEYFQVSNDNTGVDDKVVTILKIIENANANNNHNSIIMLTGSMNMATCESLAQILNLKSGRNFRTKSAAALNRSALSIIPLTIKKPEDIAKLAINHITTHSKNNLIAIFSTKKIITISENIVSHTPEFPPEIITGHKSSPYPIQNTIKLQTIAANIRDEHLSPEWMYNHLTSMLTGQNENSKFLAKCILHKFAYIFSPKNPDGTVAEFNINDVTLVQGLFKLGKINVVFTTTMVGVGVNLSVNDLYIPTIQIYPGHDISQSDITQLINRAGRKPDGFANIYCNPNDMDFIKNAIDAFPGTHIAAISLDELKGRLDYTTMIDGTVIKLNNEKYKTIMKNYANTFLKSLFKRN